ncbi:MAG TPA: aminodeoxychorismate synthase component I, partial [Actinomycetales bacterium]|nr:aminodeoxychorismate synthase component I [Actinomycetales bacterium]
MLPDTPTAAVLLRALHARARALDVPPPAAFLGDWRGSAAVIVPSVALRPAPPTRVFSGGAGLVVVGFRSFPDAVAGV